MELAGRWSGEAVGLYEWQSDAPDWTSFGLRPSYAITDFLSFAVEGGVDVVMPERDETRTLGKLTAALELKHGPKFMDRPVARAFVTTAAWDDAAERAGIAPHLDGRSGVTFGVQLEYFW